MRIIEQFVTKNPCYQMNALRLDERFSVFQERGPLGLMLHSVQCAQPDAAAIAELWNRSGDGDQAAPEDRAALVLPQASRSQHDAVDAVGHAVVQADGTVIQTLPWTYRGQHAGGDADDSYIGVEMTEPAEISYIEQWTGFNILDFEAARAQVRGTYDTAAELCAVLCDQFGLDPMLDIVSHKEAGKEGIASIVADPDHLWLGLGLDYTMDGFRAEVRRRLDALRAARSQEE